MKKITHKTMNILCATDRNFLYPAYVTIQSVIENHKNIDINFLSLSIEKIPKEYLQQLRRRYNEKKR